MRVLICTLALTSAALFAAMQFYTLPHLTALAGSPPFDLRLTGYSMQDAQTLLAAYGPAGRAYYTNVQQRLDMILPAVLGLTLILTFRHLCARRPLLQALPALFIAADYTENSLLRRILDSGPDAIDSTALFAASIATQIKFAALIPALLAFAVLLALATRHRA